MPSSSGRGDIISNNDFLGDGDCNMIRFSMKFETFNKITANILIAQHWILAVVSHLVLHFSVSFLYLLQWVFSTLPHLFIYLFVCIFNRGLQSCIGKCNLLRMHFSITDTVGKFLRFCCLLLFSWINSYTLPQWQHSWPF